MKYLYQTTIIVGIFVSALFICCTGKAKANTANLVNEEKTLLESHFIYSAAMPLYFNTQYIKTIEMNYVVINVPVDNSKTSEKKQPTRTTTFFEKANLFNDKLQSWLD